MWKKTIIDPQNLSPIIDKIETSIKTGDETLEKIRCVYILKDNPIIQCLMPWDFLEDLENKITIEKFYLYTWSN